MIIKENERSISEYDMHSDVESLLNLDRASAMATTNSVWQPIQDAKHAVSKHMIECFVECGIKESTAKEIINEINYIIDHITWES